MANTFDVRGTNTKAAFTLRAYRGEGMALLAMNWRHGRPPKDFVGFAIEYREPGETRWWPVKNRISFEGYEKDKGAKPSTFSPIQKFRWVHFPYHAELPGAFTYRVTPVFMDTSETRSYGEAQVVAIELGGETYPGVLNVCFTRGYVSSQGFVDHFMESTTISGMNTEMRSLMPTSAAEGLDFQPGPKAEDAHAWMGFEARRVILKVLQDAVDDPSAQVKVVAFDLNEPEVVTRLEALGPRLRVIIDNSKDHAKTHAAENTAEARLQASAGVANVKRQKMGQLQHNKTIIVTSPSTNTVVCGSTNFSWRGFYIQNNNAVVLQGKKAARAFAAAFDAYWATGKGVGDFGESAAAEWVDLGLPGINATASFSPHASANAALDHVAQDVEEHAKSNVFYSLAFLHQTSGSIRDAITAVTEDPDVFVYGMADQKVGGIKLQTPDGNKQPVSPAALSHGVPEPFRSEPVGGSGVHLHHKFIVIDFDKPTARVYFGSYNFSPTADTKNGENLVCVRNRRVAVAYMIEAVRLFDHYEFRIKQDKAKQGGPPIILQKPPLKPDVDPWFAKYYADPARIRDRLLFA